MAAEMGKLKLKCRTRLSRIKKPVFIGTAKLCKDKILRISKEIREC